MRTGDPELPRISRDLITLRVVMRTSDPALPRIGTDFMTLRVVMRTALPRLRTHFMTWEFDDSTCDLLVLCPFPKSL
jgi:hypothetical protein